MLLGVLFCRSTFCFQMLFGSSFVTAILLTNFKPSLADLSACTAPIEPYLTWQDHCV